MCCCDDSNLWTFKRVRSFTHLRLTSDFALTWESDHVSSLFDCYYRDSYLYITGQNTTLGVAQKIRADDATVVWGVTPNTGNENTRIVADSNGNVITGYYQVASGVHAINVYDSSGAATWDVEFGVAGGVLGLDVDSSDNVIVFGKGIAGGGNALYTILYDSAGSQQWQTVFGYATAGTGAGGVATDSNTITCAAGNSQDGIGPSGPFANVRQYDMSGSLIWRVAANAGNNQRAVAYDASGNIYVGGDRYFTGGSFKSFLECYDSAGALQWSTNLGNCNINAIAVDSLGNVYAACERVNSLNVHKLDSSGNLLASMDYHLGQSTGSNLPATGIAIDENDNVYVCGSRVIA